jgi:ribulose-phosphate 3-epimerase
MTERDDNLTYAASVMCANLLRLEDDLKALEEAGCHELHFDIMDGVFVPNITLGFDLIKAVHKASSLPCSAHLMIVRPERYVQRFVEAGCASVTVHVEATLHAQRLLTQIREAGASPGIAINPATPLTKLEYLLDYVDRVLVMTVDPGYAGQKIIPNAFERVRILRENIRHRKLDGKGFFASLRMTQGGRVCGVEPRAGRAMRFFASLRMTRGAE